MINLTNKQARLFILLKQGLIGEHKFIGSQGVLEYIQQAGCIQFDPVDLCGKNSELTLQSRVKGFSKGTLEDLLYKDRLLVDYPDKNLSIISIDDWPFFGRYRKEARQSGLRFEGLAELESRAKAYISENGFVSSGDLPMEGNLRWRSAIHWSGGWDKNNAGRAVLEQLYSTGELVIHHKKGTRKYYDLAEKHIPAKILNRKEPLPKEIDHQKWRALRRIGAVGFLWNRPSHAWLNIQGLDTEARARVFSALSAEGKIIPLGIENLKETLYCLAEDEALLEEVRKNPEQMQRCELIAPLDPFLWDRRLIKALFGFEYTWEIYTPAIKRKYGVYVLPLLYGDSIIARVEPVRDRKSSTLIIKNIWYEEGVRVTKKLRTAVDSCLNRFAEFNSCKAWRPDA